MTKEPIFQGAELATRLSALPGWSGADGWLQREYKTDGWRSTMLLVNIDDAMKALRTHDGLLPEKGVGVPACTAILNENIVRRTQI